MKKKALILLVGLLMMSLALSACGQKEKEEGLLDTDKEMLATSLENMNKVQSMASSMDMQMGMTAEGKSMSIGSKGKIEYIKDPLTMKMDMTVDAGDGNAATTQTFAETVDGTLVMYTSMGDGTWVKQDVGAAEAIQQYDTAESLKLYLSADNKFRNAGTEEINGKKTTKLEGAFSEENLSKAIESSGITSQLKLQDLDEETLKNIYKGIGSLPITIWIDNETLLPAKYEMDMSAMMDTMMKNLGAEDTGVTFDKMLLSVVIDSYNNVKAIEIPAETKDAKSMEEYTAELEQ